MKKSAAERWIVDFIDVFLFKAVNDIDEGWTHENQYDRIAL